MWVGKRPEKSASVIYKNLKKESGIFGSDILRYLSFSLGGMDHTETDTGKIQPKTQDSLPVWKKDLHNTGEIGYSC